jgi:MinD superfamily P-loop ATPase
MTVQVTVLSGKGGTGKTTVTASLATFFKGLVLADCDVDASNLHLLLKPEIKEKKPYFGHKFPVVDESLCVACGACETHCPFDAVIVGEKAAIDPTACEACGVCVEVCPVQAVTLVDQPCGEVYVSETAYGPMVHARMDPGVGTAGKLVTMVREEAVKAAGEDGLILIDGPPGIGCPVIASLAGTDIALLVIEPTISGYSDFKRVLSVVRRFKAKPCACINKYDLNEEYTKTIEAYCSESGVPVIGKIPYDRKIFDCLSQGRIPVSCAGEGIGRLYRQMYDNLNKLIEKVRSERQ